MNNIVKRILSVLIAFSVLFVVGCADNAIEQSSEEDYSVNIFNDENAVTVVSGNLSYSVPDSVVDQYEEKYKDIGFTFPCLQEYEIPSIGNISIWQANSYYNEEMWSSIGNIQLSYMNMYSTELSNKRYSEFSTLNGVTVNGGYDMYMLIDENSVQDAALYDVELEELEQRIVFFMRGLSIYLIIYEPEKGCYNEQVYNTFIDSISFVSLEDY